MPGSIIHKDCWKWYDKSSEFTEYTHHTVYQNIGFINNQISTHSNTMEGTWTGVKLNIPARYRTYKKINNFLELFAVKRNQKSFVFEKVIKSLLN